jgi:hypothetical protein
MRVRLRTKTPTEKPARVDRETGSGVIRGASLMTKGEALGHGFWIDDTTLDQVEKLADGAAGRWTHGDMCADGLGTHLGRWKNVRREGDSVLGDFHFSPLAKNVQPEGLSVDAPTYLMDAAEKEPDVVGVSAVIDIDHFDEAEPDEGSDEEPKKLARLSRVPRADYVADPAANPEGLFAGTPSELAERYSAALSVATETHGRERVESFLRAYLGRTTNTTQEAPVDIEALKKKHAEELAAKDAQLAALNATVAELKSADEKRKADELEGYIASLKKDAAPNAIEEKKLDHVRTLLKAGHGDAARAFGETLLSAAKAAPSGGEVIALGAGAPDPQVESDKVIADSLRANGWKVDQDAKGRIVNKVPPQRAGR